MNFYKSNKEKIENHIQNGYVNKILSPCGTMFILNYTRSCQYDKKWNDITIKCRGVVLDNDYNLIAYPFPKFFNTFEHSVVEVKAISQIGYESVLEKYDGSCIIAFKRNGIIYTNTRGSWSTEYSKIANRLLIESGTDLIEGYTYVFELCAPSFDKIVVKYDHDFIVCLGIFDGNFVEVPYKDLNKFVKTKIAKEYKFDNMSLEEIVKLDWDNHEGFVFKLKPNNVLSFDRFKGKFDNYMRKHFFLSHFSENVCFDFWLNDKKIDMELEEEFVQYIEEFNQKFEKQYKRCLEEIYTYANKCKGMDFKDAYLIAKKSVYSKLIMDVLRDKEMNKKVLANIINSSKNVKDYFISH